MRLDWDWVGRNLPLIGDKLIEHLSLTFLAIAVGMAISLPIAIYAHRHGWAYAPATWITGMLYTIPSLALFAFLIPFTGLSTLTAEIGLVSYTQLILIRNTVAGLRGVPADVEEAARGMGYTDRQMLWRVEIPLALPVIVAGIRIATVTIVGLVTVTVFVGKGGLGFLILNGFRPLLPEVALLIGLALSFALAIVFDGLLLLTQRALTPWGRAAGHRGAA